MVAIILVVVGALLLISIITLVLVIMHRRKVAAIKRANSDSSSFSSSQYGMTGAGANPQMVSARADSNVFTQRGQQPHQQQGVSSGYLEQGDYKDIRTNPNQSNQLNPSGGTSNYADAPQLYPNDNYVGGYDMGDVQMQSHHQQQQYAQLQTRQQYADLQI